MNIHNDPEDIEYLEAIKLRKRPVTDEQYRKFVGYAAEIFSAFGMDLNLPATRDTPRQFIKALYDATEGYDGISKLTRLVRLFSRLFAVQDRIGQQIADTLETMLHPHGVAILLEAHHLCVEMRGMRETASTTRTTVWRGHFAEDAILRTEFFSHCKFQHEDR